MINELDYSEILDRNENEQRRHPIELEEEEKKDEELGKKSGEEIEKMAISDMSKKRQWIFYAITSGGCAAANGVFAKLYVPLNLLFALELLWLSFNTLFKYPIMK